MVTLEHGRHVLVGYDGSKEAEQALRWGVEEARLRRRPLTICHAWRWPYPEPPHEGSAVGTVRLMAEHMLDRGAYIAYGQAPGLTVCTRLVTGAPAACLLNEAWQAEIIVVGSQGSGGFAGQSAGSVAQQVSAYAHCPVVVFRGAETMLRGWELRAVYGCWELPAVAGTDIALYADLDTLKRSAGARLERAVAPWREKYPQVPAWTALRLEDPRQALLEAAAQAGLLVVGDRGEGGLPGMRLGAISESMLHQAPCPTAIVHP